MPENLDILIPHYRDPDGLLQSLETIAQQTWQGEMRVIVVDDGSPDDLFAKVEQVCEQYRKSGAGSLLLERNPQNLGRPKTRNRLLTLTDATYVAWLDAGDIWYPEKLEHQFEHLLRLRLAGQNVDKIWVSCAYHWHQEGHSKPRRITQETDGDQFYDLMIGDRLRAYLWTLLGTAKSFRIAGRFDEDLPRLQDLDYFVNFVRGGGRIEVPPTRAALCCYFKSDIGRNAAQVHACYDLILRKHRPVLRRYPAAFRSMLTYKANKLPARFAYSNGAYLKTARYLAQAALRAPRHTLRVLFNVLSGRKKT